MKTISFVQGAKLCFLAVILLQSEIREHLFESSFFGLYIPVGCVYKQKNNLRRLFSVGRVSPDLLHLFRLSTVLQGSSRGMERFKPSRFAFAE